MLQIPHTSNFREDKDHKVDRDGRTYRRDKLETSEQVRTCISNHKVASPAGIHSIFILSVELSRFEKRFSRQVVSRWYIADPLLVC